MIIRLYKNMDRQVVIGMSLFNGVILQVKLGWIWLILHLLHHLRLFHQIHLLHHLLHQILHRNHHHRRRLNLLYPILHRNHLHRSRQCQNLLVLIRGLLVLVLYLLVLCLILVLCLLVLDPFIRGLLVLTLYRQNPHSQNLLVLSGLHDLHDLPDQVNQMTNIFGHRDLMMVPKEE
jgi:hypothetical protein